MAPSSSSQVQHLFAPASIGIVCSRAYSNVQAAGHSPAVILHIRCPYPESSMVNVSWMCGPPAGRSVSSRRCAPERTCSPGLSAAPQSQTSLEAQQGAGRLLQPLVLGPQLGQNQPHSSQVQHSTAGSGRQHRQQKSGAAWALVGPAAAARMQSRCFRSSGSMPRTRQGMCYKHHLQLVATA